MTLLRPNRPFTGPMPFQVVWLQDGRYRAITTYSRETADRCFEDLRKVRANPGLWLGGAKLRDAAEEKREAEAERARQSFERMLGAPVMAVGS